MCFVYYYVVLNFIGYANFHFLYFKFSSILHWFWTVPSEHEVQVLLYLVSYELIMGKNLTCMQFEVMTFRFHTFTLFLSSPYKMFQTQYVLMLDISFSTTFHIAGTIGPLLSDWNLNENFSTATMLFYSLPQLLIFYKSVSMHNWRTLILHDISVIPMSPVHVSTCHNGWF
jgi:hypothetical protein